MQNNEERILTMIVGKGYLNRAESVLNRTFEIWETVGLAPKKREWLEDTLQARAANIRNAFHRRRAMQDAKYGYTA